MPSCPLRTHQARGVHIIAEQNGAERSRAELVSRAVPSGAERSRAAPSCAERGRAEPGEPSGAERGRAGPSGAERGRAEPS